MLITDREFFSPPDIAKLLGVDNWKIIRLIHTKQLRAVDVSLNRSVRPRWRISREDLEAFLNRRANTPQPQPARTRKAKDGDVIEFYK